MTTFTTITEAVEYVEAAIGADFLSDYDIEAIAREITGWHSGKLVLIAEDAEFWAIVRDHEIAEAITIDSTKTLDGNFISAPLVSGMSVDQPTGERVTVELGGETFERTVYERIRWSNNGKARKVRARFVIINGINYVV